MAGKFRRLCSQIKPFWADRVFSGAMPAFFCPAANKTQLIMAAGHLAGLIESREAKSESLKAGFFCPLQLGFILRWGIGC